MVSFFFDTLLCILAMLILFQRVGQCIHTKKEKPIVLIGFSMRKNWITLLTPPHPVRFRTAVFSLELVNELLPPLIVL